ncbi:MAG: hypothetical protein SYC29_08170 [Planctomycetota bacterium]|nr:hypothetical protein [Planctomycetota bacterium]
MAKRTARKKPARKKTASARSRRATLENIPADEVGGTVQAYIDDSRATEVSSKQTSDGLWTIVAIMPP